MKNLFFILITLFISTQSANALPIDWHGVFGCDTTSIDNYRRLDQTSSTYSVSNLGSQEVDLGSGGHANANWQTCIFKLQPNIIINDSATLKAEFGNGYGRTNRVGEDVSQNKENGFGNALYPYNFASGNDTVNINKLYMELYADTATYVIGRHTSHYGLGAIVNSGEDTWDRFAFIRDGITVKLKIGNFSIEPFWTRVGSNNSLTKSTRIKEYGTSLLYDNVERDLAFGILYTKKSNAPFSSDYTADTGANLPATGSATSYPSLGKTDVKLTDLYFSKTYGIFDFGVEVPILSGEIGNVFGQADTKYKSRAIILETNVKLSDSFSVGFDGGQVSGHDGNLGTYEAMYLNPNYQVANLLFKYNLGAVSDPSNKDVYDSYTNNTKYIKFNFEYSTEKWVWDFAVIKAWAEEAAKIGQNSYNHSTNKTFVAINNQSDDLGLELDVNFNYAWNTEINIGGAFGYLFTGDYFGFNNTATPLSVDNSFVIQLNTAISF